MAGSSLNLNSYFKKHSPCFLHRTKPTPGLSVSAPSSLQARHHPFPLLIWTNLAVYERLHPPSSLSVWFGFSLNDCNSSVYRVSSMAPGIRLRASYTSRHIIFTATVCQVHVVILIFRMRQQLRDVN